MKKLFKIFTAAALAALCLSACNTQKEPFPTAGEDDSPRILNTDIPEGSAGEPAQLMNILRNSNFEFEIIVTPVKYTTVTWNIDGEDVFEGLKIDMPLLAGNHLVKVTATTTKGLSTTRTFTVAVTPLGEDPVMAVSQAYTAPGQNLALEGEYLDGVKKVFLGSEPAEIVSATFGELVIAIPSNLPTGIYPVYFENNLGETLGAVYDAGDVYESFSVVSSPDPFVLADAFSARPGAEVTLEGINMNKVKSILVDGNAATIVSQSAGDLVFKCPEVEAGEHTLTGTATDGSAVSFMGSDSAVLTVVESAEEVIWKGSHEVTWGTPFDGIKDTLLGMVGVGYIVRGYVYGEGQGCLATSWWNNIYTGEGDPNRGDVTINGEMVLEYTLTDKSLELLEAQNGALFVGNGYTITKVTIEAPSEHAIWEGSFNVTWGTPFNELQSTFASMISVGNIVRAYVTGSGQGCLATAWWRNLATGHSDDDEGRGDTPIDGDTVLELVVSELSMQLLAEQDGFLLVGDGYTVTKITVE